MRAALVALVSLGLLGTLVPSDAVACCWPMDIWGKNGGGCETSTTCGFVCGAFEDVSVSGSNEGWHWHPDPDGPGPAQGFSHYHRGWIRVTATCSDGSSASCSGTGGCGSGGARTYEGGHASCRVEAENVGVTVSGECHAAGRAGPYHWACGHATRLEDTYLGVQEIKDWTVGICAFMMAYEPEFIP
jgi:hypothetical protein